MCLSVQHQSCRNLTKCIAVNCATQTHTPVLLKYLPNTAVAMKTNIKQKSRSTEWPLHSIDEKGQTSFLSILTLMSRANVINASSTFTFAFALVSINFTPYSTANCTESAKTQH